MSVIGLNVCWHRYVLLTISAESSLPGESVQLRMQTSKCVYSAMEDRLAPSNSVYVHSTTKCEKDIEQYISNIRQKMSKM